MNHIIIEDADKIIEESLDWEQLKNSTVLITGISGMLGGYMAAVLIRLNQRKNYNIKIYGLLRNPGKLSADVRQQITVIQQSVTETIDIDVKFDYVIHTASPASPLIMRNDPVGTVAANALGTWNTLEVAQKSNAKGYIFISSREIYGQPYKDQEFFTEETYGFVDPLDPRSCYPEGKKVAETMCACYRKQYGLNTKIARLAHTFGPGMSIDDGRVQADFLRNVVNHEDIVLKSEGTAIRTYTYVGDAVKALFYILLNSDEMVYNISSEADTVSIRDLAQTLVDAFPERGLKLVFDIPEADQNSGCAPFTLGILNSDKLHKLGWKPDYRLDEGLKRTVRYLEGK